MPLRGQSAVVIWSDMADPAAHDLWHSREHLPERIAIPGFLRARRCVTLVADAPRYFVLYELKDEAILTSPAYLARLNQPTPWTAKTMESVRALSRTLCGVAASHGDGVGAHLMAVRLAPQASLASQLQVRLDDLLAKLAQQPGLVGAHLLQREQAVARPDTIERQLRRHEDGFVDWVVVVEGYDATALGTSVKQLLSANSLEQHGAAQVSGFAGYQLQHLMCAEDL
jgi:hypothetical protein